MLLVSSIKMIIIRAKNTNKPFLPQTTANYIDFFLYTPKKDVSNQNFVYKVTKSS